MTDAENLVRDRRVMLIVWSLMVVVAITFAVGFGGSVAAVFTADNMPAWLLLVSPSIPLALSLKAKWALRRD